MEKARRREAGYWRFRRGWFKPRYRHCFFLIFFKFNVYLQPYDYNRYVLFWDASFASAFIHSFDPFLIHPFLRRLCSAGVWPLGSLTALLILYLVARNICCRAAPPILDPLSAALSSSPSRPRNPLLIKYYSNGFTACSFASRLANQLLFWSALPPYSYHFKLYSLEPLFSPLHFLRLVYLYSAHPHHQHSTVSTNPIQPSITAPCPALS